MSEPGDGQWDAPTEHDDQALADDASLDPQRATLAQAIRAARAARDKGPGTLPPPAAERAPASSTSPPAAASPAGTSGGGTRPSAPRAITIPPASTGATRPSTAPAAAPAPRTTQPPARPSQPLARIIPSASASASPARTTLTGLPAPLPPAHDTMTGMTAVAEPPSTSSFANPSDHITPVALPEVTEAARRASAELEVADIDKTPVASAAVRAVQAVAARAGTDESVLLLDMVARGTPASEPPRDTAAGGVVVVATGSDAERVRELCHGANLLVPIMASLSVVHEAMAAIVIGEPSPPAPPRVVHVVRPSVTDDMLLALLRATATGRTSVEPPTASDVDAAVVAAAHRIAAHTERQDLEIATREAVTTLASADRVHVLFHEPRTGELWSDVKRVREGDDRRATAGIVGWCAHTGEAVHASPAGDDPRYLTEIDDPGEGKAQTRLLVQPVIGADRRVHALLVAVRRWRHADFGDPERRALRTLAALIAPSIDVAASSPPPPPRPTHATLPGVASTPDAIPPPTPLTPSGPLSAAPPGESGQVQAAVSETSERRRSKTEPPPRARRASGDAGEPHDLALVAASRDDVPRLERLVRKARLEVSVLTRTEDAPPYYRVVTIGHPWTPDGDARVAYAARGSISDDQLSELLVGLATDRAAAPVVVAVPQTAADARTLQRAYAASRRLATAGDLASLELAAIAAIRDLVAADRAYCLCFDSDTGALWSERRKRASGDDRRAVAGITGWAAHTGRAVSVPRASADPRWLGPLDDADGDPNSQLLVQPIVAPDRRVLGVLVAVRRPRRTPFSAADDTLLARFAALACPHLEHALLAAATARVLEHGGSEPGDAELAAARPPLITRMRRLGESRVVWAIGGATVAAALLELAGC